MLTGVGSHWKDHGMAMVGNRDGDTARGTFAYAYCLLGVICALVT